MDLIADIATNFDLVVFTIVGAIVVISAIMMLESKDLSHAIIFLALTFAGIGVIYIDLNAEFIAMIQMTVYTGGVVILFLFALMLTRSEEFQLRGDLNRGMSMLIGLLLISVFVFIIVPLGDLWVNGLVPLNIVDASDILDPNHVGNTSNFPNGIAWIGFALFNYYQISFMILGFIVVGALLGTIYIVKNEPGEDTRIVSPASLTTEDKSS